LEFCGDSRGVLFLNAAQILYCLGLQFDLHNSYTQLRTLLSLANRLLSDTPATGRPLSE
jgi:hypothetical protein